MLTENQVIEYFCNYLKNDGYQIKQSLNTKEKGIDIIASKNGRLMKAEAKGSTSALKTSSNYGKEFSKSQVHTHISVALFMISKLMTDDNDKNIDYAFVLPFNDNHVKEINSISLVLKKLNITVFLVQENGGIVEFI